MIGISPAFGIKLFQTIAGHPLSAVLRELIGGITEGGGDGPRRAHEAYRRHVVPRPQRRPARRAPASASASRPRAPRSSTSKDRLPHNNLELFSNAPITRLEHYRRMGANAAAYALGEMPEPVVVPTRGEAMGSRYHARVALIYAIETELTSEGAAPEDVEVAFLGSAA